MKTKFYLLFFSLVIQIHLYGQDAHAQTGSMRQLLFKARTDTQKVRLRYQIGRSEHISRISYWDSLLTDTRKHRLPFYECRVLEKLGRTFLAQGDLIKAKSAYNRGILIAEKQNDLRGIMELVRAQECLAAMECDRKQSLYLIYKGLQIAEKLNDKRSINDVYSSLARYYLTSGETKKALAIHLRCLKLCREIRYGMGIACALVDIGSDYVTLLQNNKAIPYYLESKQYIPICKGTLYASQICSSVSVAYMYLHQYDSAFYYINKSYDLARNINDKRGMASALTICGRIYYESGNNTAARQNIEKAIVLSRSVTFIAQLPDLYDVLKKIHIKDHHYKDALMAYEQQIAARDSMSGEKARKQAMEKAFAYRFEKKENENKLLAQENQIQALRLTRSRYLQFGLGGLFIVILVIIYLVVRQNRLRQEHQRVHMEQKLLLAQMDPHFVFNSLNAVQQFVMQGQNDQAERYLNKVSALIRNQLEISTREYLTVDEEVRLLNAYLEMESLRFDHAFSYSVKVDDAISQLHTLIPHMMIQPFVENAIWHGLLPKAGNRLLKVKMKYESAKTIKCIVDDNGVGRSADMQKERQFKKRSLALGFVQQRIDLIKKTYKIAGSVNFTDKKEAGHNAGTTVVIILPILNT